MRDYEINSDLKQDSFKGLKFAQYDNGSTIKVNLFEDGQVVDLTDCTVIAKYKREDKEEYNRSANVAGNVITTTLDSTVTAVAGTLKIIFKITYGDKQVSTFMLVANIKENFGEGNSGNIGGNTGGSVDVDLDLSAYQKITDNTLNTTNKTVTGAINEISSQFQTIANELKLVAGENNTIKLMLGTKELSSLTISGGTVEPTPVTYSITNTLSNCSNSNTFTSIEENSSYSASISANEGYRLKTVTVTMGGIDITSDCYSNGTINIASVTGDIVITVETEIVQDTVVGSIDSDNNISLTGLTSGTYTLKYEDASGNVLDSFDTIAEMEVV